MTHVRAIARLPRAVVPPAEAEEWLPEPHRRSGVDQWTVALPLGPWHHDAKVRLGHAWVDDAGTSRPIAWHPTPRGHDVLPYERLFPPVCGEVVVSGDVVEIRAGYDPPAGPVGRAIDLVARGLARRAVRQMAREIAGALGARTRAGGEGS